MAAHMAFLRLRKIISKKAAKGQNKA